MTWSPLNALRAVRELDVPATQRVVLYALVSRSDPTGACFPSMTRLASDTGQAEQTCRRALAAIVSTGLVTRRGGKGRPYTYDLRPLCNPGQRVTPVTESPRSERPDTPVRETDPPRSERPDTPVRETDEVVHEVAQNKKPKNVKPDPRVQDVWDYFIQCRTLSGRPPVFSRKRRAQIRRRLETFSADDLKQAIRVLWSPGSFWVAHNHTTPEYVFRSDEQVEKLLARLATPAAAPRREQRPPPPDVMPPDPDRLASLLTPTGTESP